MSFADIFIILLITGGATKAAAFFAANTGHLSLAERRSIAVRSVLIQAIILGVFTARGPNILHLFHVSIAALEVAGGLILLLFAIGLVLGEDHSADVDGRKGDVGMAAYPMAVPLLASPQAIVAITIFSTQAGVGNRGMIWAALAVTLALNLAILLGLAQFTGAKPDAKKGPGGAAVLLRVVALLLAALAIEIMALGLRGYGVLGPMPEAAPAAIGAAAH
jgi:multiple antibiotic resistance protein